MGFREFIKMLEEDNRLLQVDKPVSKNLQISAFLKKIEPNAVLFKNVVASEHKVIGNVLGTKSTLAQYFSIKTAELIPYLANAIDQRRPCTLVSRAACQEAVDLHPDLDTLPLLRHFENDGGNYLTSGVVIARHPVHGQNADFHRCMQYSKTEMSMRVVKRRHFDIFLNDLQQIDIAVCIGVSPAVLIAAGISVDLGIDELEIANSLEPVPVVWAKTVELLVPAEAEFVLEGTVYASRRHPEGPFVDITETQDIIRQEPVFEVKAITHRHDAFWHALLPGGLEHKLLMGMPREPTIYKQVNQVVRCLDVNLSPGGCSWLHAIVQIDKASEEDGKKATYAALEGHKSCKHIFIVDKDIDIYNPLEIEWAMATRFQGNKRMYVLEDEIGSSLDPSADPKTSLTTKIGFDLTKPLSVQGNPFDKVAYSDIDLREYLDD